MNDELDLHIILNSLLLSMVLVFYDDADQVMTLEQFLDRIKQGDSVDFNETLRIISEYYHYRSTAFQNGPVYNAAGQNEGSCRVLAFARLHDLTAEQTLQLFGEHYRDVLRDSEGTGHANIRAFMAHGWAGIAFENEPLRRIDISDN